MSIVCLVTGTFSILSAVSWLIFCIFFPLGANKAPVVARRSFPSGLQPGKELDRSGMFVNVCC